MTLPPESERSNLDWLTALRADSDQAWAAIRERVLRSLRAYLRSRGRALDHDLEALAEDAVQDTLLTVEPSSTRSGMTADSRLGSTGLPSTPCSGSSVSDAGTCGRRRRRAIPSPIH